MRILQISDLHLPCGSGASGDEADTLAVALALLDHLRHQAADLLVVTGDVAGETESSFAYEQLSAALQSFPYPWLALPGNHDRGDLFRTVLSTHAVNGFAVHERAERDVDIMFFDTSPETFDADSVMRLRNHLARARGTQCLFTHYPPTPVGHPSFDGKHRLTWREPFLDALQSSLWPLHVFFGHIHFEFQSTIGRLHLYSVPSATVPTIPGKGIDLPDPAGPCYRRIDVSADGIRTALCRLPVAGSLT